MNGLRTILLAGDGTLSLLYDLLSDENIRVRMLTRDAQLAAVLTRLRVDVEEGDLDDCPRIRRALKDVRTVIAAPRTMEEARNLIKVAAGADIDMLVIITAAREPLEAYAWSAGLEPRFVAPDDTRSIGPLINDEVDDTTWPGTSLPFFP
jgi:hypothetical protein